MLGGQEALRTARSIRPVVRETEGTGVSLAMGNTCMHRMQVEVQAEVEREWHGVEDCFETAQPVPLSGAVRACSLAERAAIGGFLACQVIGSGRIRTRSSSIVTAHPLASASAIPGTRSSKTLVMVSGSTTLRRSVIRLGKVSAQCNEV